MPEEIPKEIPEEIPKEIPLICEQLAIGSEITQIRWRFLRFGALRLGNGYWLIQGDLQKSCNSVLKLGFLWVCGSSACRRCADIVLEPTNLWVCDPCTWLKAAFRFALVQSDRASNAWKCRFRVQLLENVCPQTWPRFHYLPSFKPGLKKSTCYLRRMC